MKLLPILAIPAGFILRVLRLSWEERIGKRRSSHWTRTRCNHRWRNSLDRIRIGFRVPCVTIPFQIDGLNRHSTHRGAFTDNE
jgi:hypothetical protein